MVGICGVGYMDFGSCFGGVEMMGTLGVFFDWFYLHGGLLLLLDWMISWSIR
jgi:hypothetical protein